ncbi:TatD family hydrolase, partial [Neisseria sp. P0018.S003]|uniref:TatD family hydrolase n=1 Tax=Neisseria sp. P0018.S003 TaxID=3436789 RepID=UPI003F7EE24F
LKAGQTHSCVIHCFTAYTAFSTAALALWLYLSFPGIVTFTNVPQLQAASKYVPAARMLVETDSPVLAPVPKRGKPNEPSYVRYTTEFVSKLRGEPLETLAAYASDNFYRLFNKVPYIQV